MQDRSGRTAPAGFAKSFAEIHAPCLPSWDQPENDSGKKRDERSHAENISIQRHTIAARQAGPGDAQHDGQSSPSQEKSYDPSQNCEENAFRHELTHNAGASRAQGNTHGYFAPPACGADE